MNHVPFSCLLALTGLLALAASGCDDPGQPVGPDGGTVLSADGRLSVTIPPGALNEEVRVSIVEDLDGPEGSLGPAYSLKPLALGFRLPATVRYDTEGLAMDELSMSEVALVIKKEDTWFYLADQRSEGREVAATAVYLSTYAVIGLPDGDVKDHESDFD